MPSLEIESGAWCRRYDRFVDSDLCDTKQACIKEHNGCANCPQSCHAVVQFYPGWRHKEG